MPCMPCMPYGVPLQQQHQQVPTPAYIFQAPTPMQMAPAQQMAVQDILTTEAKKKPSTCVKATKQQRHAELATVLKAPSAKKGEKERQYEVADLQNMMTTCLTAGRGILSVACDAGFPKAARTLGRYVRSVKEHAKLQRATPAETLAAQLEFVSQLGFKIKGHSDMCVRRLFSEDELDTFARAINIYSEMGWPLDFQNIRLMFQAAAKKAGRIDWLTGQPFAVSRGYVRKFVTARPELHPYTMSHIDPLRSKKATAKVNAWREEGVLALTCAAHSVGVSVCCRCHMMLQA
eukprot:1584445-Prymnesium_polylepis.1